jgi:hypothetical protein
MDLVYRLLVAIHHIPVPCELVAELLTEWKGSAHTRTLGSISSASRFVAILIPFTITVLANIGDLIGIGTVACLLKLSVRLNSAYHPKQE